MSSEFLADGYERALAGIEAKVRPVVEEKYAEEWEKSGLLKRWSLRRTIEREIRDRVCELATDLNPDALY